jgi:LmbE family N-acetylglucosaminyl deacetylase
MRLSFNDDRVLAVMAHPDDAELLCAGTLARSLEEGDEVAICVMCKGDKGAGSSEKSNDLGAVRKTEATAAAGVLGAQLFWFGGGDGELFDSYENRRKLIQIYRQFQPTLVITHAMEDYHPDHRATSQIAEAASWFCASRGHDTESPAMTNPPAVWFADTLEMSGFTADFFVDVTAHVDVKKRMLASHKSQLQRGKDGDFTPLMDLMMRQCQMRGAQSNVAAAEAFRWHWAFKRARAF